MPAFFADDYVQGITPLLKEAVKRTMEEEAPDLLDLVEQLTEKGVEFVSQKEAIDTSTPTGKFMLTIFGAVAELEREYILQRQREGIDIAKANGVYKGRKPLDPPAFNQMVSKWQRGEITAAAAIEQLGISKATFYRRVSQSQLPGE